MHRSWHGRYDPGVPFSLAHPNWTLPDMLRRSVNRFPNSPALLFYGACLTYHDLDHLATRFAISLRSLGVRPQDRVAIMLPNLPQALIAYYGALLAGAVVVQINPLYVSREIEAQLTDSGSETMVALDLFHSRIEPIRERTALKRTILTGVQDFLPPLRRLLYPIKARMSGHWTRIKKDPSMYEFLGLLKGSAEGDTSPLPSLGPDDLALLQYSGGTTGTAKGVMLTHRNLVANAFQCRYWVPDFREGHEVFLGVIPFFHAYGLSTCQHLAVLAGCPLILLPRFQVTEVLEAIQKYRVTIFSGIPAMFMKVSESPKVGRYDLRSLRVCLSGASPLRAEVQDRFRRLIGVEISEGYGLTEASPVTHCNPVYGEHPEGSIGVPFPDTDVRLVDLDSGERAVPAGGLGELVVRGPQVMQGYWNKPAETRSVLRDGWLYTGDIAREDARGFFYLVDRKKDMIKSRGETVYPREVEDVLCGHPAVQEAVVVGVPDPLLGEAVKAYVVLAEGRRLSEQELIGYCRQGLAKFKVPSTVEFRQELPRTFVGKALRRVLREEAAPKVGVG